MHMEEMHHDLKGKVWNGLEDIWIGMVNWTRVKVAWLSGLTWNGARWLGKLLSRCAKWLAEVILSGFQWFAEVIWNGIKLLAGIFLEWTSTVG